MMRRATATSARPYPAAFRVNAAAAIAAAEASIATAEAQTEARLIICVILTFIEPQGAHIVSISQPLPGTHIVSIS